MAKTDSEDELKRQMRRRLVGAVALVTALVIILPMLLESAPDPRAGSLELRIPDKDRAGTFSSQMVVAESAPEIIPEPSAGKPQEAAQAQPVSAPASAVPPAPSKPSTVKAEPAHKPAKPEHKAEEHKTEEHKAGFAVQVGAFSHAASAKELLEKLRKQGWHAYTEKAGETIRVRVGPYASHGSAEQALHKLEAQGMQPAIVGEP
jgi:DedD protein